MSVKAGKHARELLLKEYRGVLSTHSKAMPGSLSDQWCPIAWMLTAIR